MVIWNQGVKTGDEKKTGSNLVGGFVDQHIGKNLQHIGKNLDLDLGDP